MKLNRFILALFTCLVIVVTIDAQCPMCRMSVESNLENTNGAAIGRTINAGILYMLLMPYILVGTLAYVWYKNYKKGIALQDSDTSST